MPTHEAPPPPTEQESSTRRAQARERESQAEYAPPRDRATATPQLSPTTRAPAARKPSATGRGHQQRQDALTMSASAPGCNAPLATSRSRRRALMFWSGRWTMVVYTVVGHQKRPVRNASVGTRSRASGPGARPQTTPVLYNPILTRHLDTLGPAPLEFHMRSR